MMMQGSKLWWKIHVLNRAVVPDEDTGEQNPQWTILYENLPAKMVKRGAVSRVIGRELVSDNQILWSIRHKRHIDSNMRIEFESEMYQIDGVYRGPGRRIELFLLTTKESPERDNTDAS